MNKNIVVIGSINMDIGGSPAGELLMQDSNPGTVTLSPGGVGRNIAHNLRLLGAKVSFISAFGGDSYAIELLKNCGALGMDVGMSLFLPDKRSSVYLYIEDEKGEMQLAINEMDILKSLSPGFLAHHIEKINAADAVVLDANIPQESIEYLAENCHVPIYCDPVSAAKAKKLRPILAKTRLIKPNALEAAALSGCQEPESAAEALLASGCGRVFISLGAEGILAAEKGLCLRLPCVKGEIVNTTGAGDAATAALCVGDLMGLSLSDCAKLALKAGAVTSACSQTNNPALGEIIG